MTVTLTADQDSVDNMQPVYISTLEERLQVTGGGSSSSTAFLHTENMDTATTRKTAAELPILEHDIFKKFQQPTAAAKAAPSSTKRKMPLSFASLPLAADADLNSSNNSIVSISSPEQEVAASQDREDISQKKKTKKPKLHHETAEASGSSSEARDVGELIERIRMTSVLYY